MGDQTVQDRCDYNFEPAGEPFLSNSFTAHVAAAECMTTDGSATTTGDSPPLCWTCGDAGYDGLGTRACFVCRAPNTTTLARV